MRSRWSRRRDPLAEDYGFWSLLDKRTREQRFPTGDRLGVKTLDEIEEHLL